MCLYRSCNSKPFLCEQGAQKLIAKQCQVISDNKEATQREKTYKPISQFCRRRPTSIGNDFSSHPRPTFSLLHKKKSCSTTHFPNICPTIKRQVLNMEEKLENSPSVSTPAMGTKPYFSANFSRPSSNCFWRYICSKTAQAPAQSVTAHVHTKTVSVFTTAFVCDKNQPFCVLDCHSVWPGDQPWTLSTYTTARRQHRPIRTLNRKEHIVIVADHEKLHTLSLSCYLSQNQTQMVHLPCRSCRGWKGLVLTAARTPGPGLRRQPSLAAPLHGSSPSATPTPPPAGHESSSLPQQQSRASFRSTLFRLAPENRGTTGVRWVQSMRIDFCSLTDRVVLEKVFSVNKSHWHFRKIK